MSNIRTLAFLEAADLCLMYARNLSSELPGAMAGATECGKILTEAAELASQGKDVYSLVTTIKGQK